MKNYFIGWADVEYFRHWRAFNRKSINIKWFGWNKGEAFGEYETLAEARAAAKAKNAERKAGEAVL